MSGSNLLDPTTFAANPLAGAPLPATIAGTGATLLPDAPATGTGSVTGLTGSTNLVTLGVTSGDQISVSDGTNTTTYTVTNTSTVANLEAALSNGGANLAQVNVTLQGGHLQIQSSNGLDIDTDTITDTTASLGSLGFGAGNTTFAPTNLITQHAVAANQTLTVTVGANPTQTITFGPGTGQVATLAGLNTALGNLANISAAGTGIDANGNLKIVASNTTDPVTLGGTFSPAAFGVTNSQALPANGTVFGADNSTFLSESIAGGSITSFSGTGAPVNVEFRWAKTDSASLGTGHTDTWNMFYQTNSNPTNTQAAWLNVGTNFTFNSSGQLTPPLSSLTLSNVNIDGQTLGNVQVAFGSGGLTQFANTNGTTQVNLLNQNGASAGQLQSIAVDDQGRVVGTYSNGRTVPLADVDAGELQRPEQPEAA